MDAAGLQTLHGGFRADRLPDIMAIVNVDIKDAVVTGLAIVYWQGEEAANQNQYKELMVLHIFTRRLLTETSI